MSTTQPSNTDTTPDNEKPTITSETARNIIHSIERATKIPGTREYTTHKPDHAPSVYKIRKHYDTWTQFKEENFHPVFEQICIDSMRDVANKTNKSPTKRSYNEHSDDDTPHAQAIKRHWGSWNDAKKAAGLEAHQDGKPSNYRIVTNYIQPAPRNAKAEIRQEEGECQHCGLSNEGNKERYGRVLDVHHIYPFHTFFDDLDDDELEQIKDCDPDPELEAELYRRNDIANHPSNMVSLCRACHRALETKPLDKQLELTGRDEPEVHPDDARR